MNDYTVVDYILDAKIEGAFCECGVQTGKIEKIWIKKLQERNDISRDIYLYDTFTGLTEPGEKDVGMYNGLSSPQAVYNEWNRHNVGNINTMCYCPLETVMNDLYKTNYPLYKLHFIKGDVRETLLNKNYIPEKIAVLRLDTDWYDSSKIELETMFQYLVPGGVLILDDYGWWKGQKDATDEFFKGTKYQYLITRVKIPDSHVYYLIK
jgi:O-methyltransferase